MKKILILVTLVSLLSCEDKVETRYMDVRALSASELYRGDSVFSYLNRYKEQNKDLADAYKEKSQQQKDNREKAIYYLKRSISLFPNQQSYLELASLLFNAQRYDELNRLYYLTNYSQYVKNSNQKMESIYLFGPPTEDMVYENIICNILRRNYLYAEEIYLIEEAGFNRLKLKERLIADSRITLDKNSATYKNILLQFLPYNHLDSIARQPESFRNFLTSLRDTNDHFQINSETVSEFNYDNFNGRYGDDGMSIGKEAIDVFYLKEKQENKDKWIQFNFNHFYKAFPSVNVIVYAIDTSTTACPREMRHVYHRLVTYNENGGIIDSRVIALQSAEDQKTAIVNKTTITVQQSKRIWKKPYAKWEFDNSVTNTEVLGTESFEILADGSIKQLESVELSH
jgi:hypothetical protein